MSTAQVTLRPFALALIASLLIPLGSCSKEPDPGPSRAQASPEDEDEERDAQLDDDTSLTVAQADPAVGEQHFNMNCSPCHQIGGVGRPGLAPSIRNRDFLAVASDKFIRATVAVGRPGTAMIPRPDLSHRVVTEIIAYLRSLETTTPSLVKPDPSRKVKGDLERGGAHFAVYCSYCHGPAGEGYSAGGAGPGIGLPHFLATASDDFLFQTIKHGRSGTAMRSFSGAKGLANMNDQDINDVIAWLRRPK